MIVYFIKASFVLLVFWGFHKLFLEKESFFAQNRIYLLSCVLLTFLLPFAALPDLIPEQGALSEFIATYALDEKEQAEGQVAKRAEEKHSPSYVDTLVGDLAVPQKQKTTKETVIAARENITEKATIRPIAKQVEVETNRSWTSWLLIIYYFGLFIFVMHLLTQVASLILKVIKSTDKIKDENYTIINSSLVKEPCSFFNYIFINPEAYDFETYEQIIEHEKIHVRKKHSIDLLLSELAIIVLWFNPLIWQMRKEVEKNIEYQTDDLLLHGEPEIKELYQMNLLKIASYSRPLRVTTNYNQSLLKQRILRMNTKKSNPHSFWKYTFVLPLLFGLLLLINKPSTAFAQEAVIFSEDFDASTPKISKDAAKKEIEETANIVQEQSEPENEFQQIANCKAFENAVAKGDLKMVKELLKSLDPDCLKRTMEEQASNLDLPTNNERIEKPSSVNTDITLEKSSLKDAECIALEKAAKTKDYTTVRALLNDGELECLISQKGVPNDDRQLIKSMLANGANLDINSHGQIRIYGTSEIISWGDTDAQRTSEPAYQQLKKAAFANNIPEVRKLLSNFTAKSFIDEDGTINDFSYIRNLMKSKAEIAIDDQQNIIIYGLEVYVDFPVELSDNQVLYLNEAGNSLTTEEIDALESASYYDQENVNEKAKGLKSLTSANQALTCEALIKAIQSEQHTDIENILKNFDPNCIHITEDSEGEDRNGEKKIIIRSSRSPLSAAARVGDVKIGKLLLKAGADIEMRAEGDESPLMAAAAKGNLDFVKFLVKNGAEINRNHKGEGSKKTLIYTATKGHTLTYLAYLKKDLRMYKRVPGKGTALAAAVRNGHTDVADYPRAQGAK